jgi:hypothetical protein
MIRSRGLIGLQVVMMLGRRALFVVACFGVVFGRLFFRQFSYVMTLAGQEKN